MTRSGYFAAAALAVASGLGLAGCTGAGAAGSGGGVATAVTVATANPLLGAGAGAAAGWAANRAGTYQEAQMHAAVAEATARARADEIVPWESDSRLPVGRSRGTVTVTDFRRIDDRPCKDVVFTVVEGVGLDAGDYAGTVCRAPEGWQMAEAHSLDEQQWQPPEAQQAAPADKAWQPPKTPTAQGGGRAAS